MTAEPSPPTAVAHLNVHRGLLLGTFFLYAVTNYLYAPTLPVYVESKTGNLALAGLVLSMYGLWQLVIRIPLGVAIDRLGRCKPFIVAGFAVAALGAALMGRSDGVLGLAIGRSLTGLSAGVFGPLIVLFSGLFLGEQSVRASSWATTMGSIGIMLATSVTGFLNEAGGYSLAFMVAAAAAMVAMAVVSPVYERRRPPNPASGQGLGRLVRRREVLTPSLVGAAVQYGAAATTYGFLPILAGQMGARDVTLGILMSVQVAMLSVGSLLAGALNKRVRAWLLVSLALGLFAFGVALAALAPAVWLLFAAQGCIGLAWGLSYPVIMAMSFSRVPDRERNSAMGVFQTGCSLGVFAGAWVSGLLASLLGIRAMFGTTALALLALALILSRRADD